MAMLYLGIDQHARQLTISLRDESGDVLQARQVSTQPEKLQAFFQRLTRERLTNSFRKGPTRSVADRSGQRVPKDHLASKNFNRAADS
jgi:hypothetical protein